MNTVKLTIDQLNNWKGDLDLWELDQISGFFRDEATGQLGAICIGRSVGSVSYFRAIS